jgi:hypothetical protein
LERNFLHAAAIEFHHPKSGNLLHLEAPLPDDLSNFLDVLDREAK